MLLAQPEAEEFVLLRALTIVLISPLFGGFPGSSDGKGSARNVRDPGSIPGLGRSHVEGNGNPLQYSCLENPVAGGGTWQAIVHGVTTVHGVAYYSPHFLFIFRIFLFCWVSGVQVKFTFSAHHFQVLDDADSLKPVWQLQVAVNQFGLVHTQCEPVQTLTS